MAEALKLLRFFNSVFLQYFKQLTTCLQMNHNRLATTLAQSIPCIPAGPTDIDMDVERHFMNGKLIFNSVYR